MAVENSFKNLVGANNKDFDESNISTNILLLLLDLIEDVTQTSGFNELLDKVCTASHKLLNVEASSIMLLDESENCLKIVMCTGPAKDEVMGKKIPADEGYAGWVIDHKEPIIANDITKESDIFFGELSEDFKTCSLICVPLFDDEKKIIGVLQAINRKGNDSFTEEEAPVFQALANHSARSIQRVSSKEKLARLLKEQNVFLQEIHHRVKNDFALISGIIQMGKVDAESGDTQTVLDNVQSRIHAMVGVHEMLANKNVDSKINAAEYFNDLVQRISANLSGKEQKIAAKVSVSDFQLSSRPALSCGLIINELMMNSFKHAFEPQNKNEISLFAVKEGETIRLVYKDNGKGLPEGFDANEQNSMGFKIINALIKQLHGTLDIDGQNGTAFVIKFPQ